jgi:hypothetical protein
MALAVCQEKISQTNQFDINQDAITEVIEEFGPDDGGDTVTSGGRG